MNAVTARRAPPWWLRDFRHMRRAALVFAVVAGAAVAAVAGTRHGWHAARDRQLAAAHARDLARRQFAQVEQEQHDIALFQPIYRQLLARRLVGTENRLDWIDALRRIQDQYHLPPIAYDIAPRQPVVVSPAMDLGRSRLYTTRMRVQMDLPHEGDLFALLSGVRALGHGTVQECTLTRSAAAPSAPLAPTVAAACTLNWVTLAGSGAPAPLPSQAGPPLAQDGGLAGGAAAPPLGRLFTTPQQRAGLDAQRHGAGQPAVTAAAAPAPPPPLVLNGVVRPARGKATVWLDQEAVPDGRRIVGADGRVTLILPSGRRVTLKPGQRYDETSGEVRDDNR